MSTKAAATENPVIDLIKNRWSPRSFSDKTISVDSIQSIIEAASWSFSAANEQPWRYIVAHKGTPLFEKLFSVLMPGNQPWNKNSAVLILSLGNKYLINNGNENGNMGHDVGAANMLLTLQANSMGIYTHPMAGFDKVKTKEVLELSDEFVPVILLALGYLDDADKLEEPFKSRELAPRSRKAIDEILLNYEN